MRTPRIILGDSPAVCLKYARHALARAKRAARMGDRKEAGRWWNEAGETGMLPALAYNQRTGTMDTERTTRQLTKAYAEARAVGMGFDGPPSGPGHIGEV